MSSDSRTRHRSDCQLKAHAENCLDLQTDRAEFFPQLLLKAVPFKKVRFRAGAEARSFSLSDCGTAIHPRDEDLSPGTPISRALTLRSFRTSALACARAEVYKDVLEQRVKEVIKLNKSS